MEDIPLSCLIAGGFTNYTRLHEKKNMCVRLVVLVVSASIFGCQSATNIHLQ